jgi:hypothetical protein
MQRQSVDVGAMQSANDVRMNDAFPEIKHDTLA